MVDHDCSTVSCRSAFEDVLIIVQLNYFCACPYNAKQFHKKKYFWSSSPFLYLFPLLETATIFNCKTSAVEAHALERLWEQNVFRDMCQVWTSHHPSPSSCSDMFDGVVRSGDEVGQF